ncbi:hypothetical protein TNCV_4107601 [Trichonephila clavipes]|nr:hypothetical protein TNCV_4107601 [Trichonephila clavipes]
MASLSHQSLPPTDLGRVDEEMGSPDFYEVWLLPESEATVAAVVGDHRCHTPRMYSWGTADQAVSTHCQS